MLLCINHSSSKNVTWSALLSQERFDDRTLFQFEPHSHNFPPILNSLKINIFFDISIIFAIKQFWTLKSLHLWQKIPKKIILTLKKNWMTSEYIYIYIYIYMGVQYVGTCVCARVCVFIVIVMNFIDLEFEREGKTGQLLWYAFWWTLNKILVAEKLEQYGKEVN